MSVTHFMAHSMHHHHRRMQRMRSTTNRLIGLTSFKYRKNDKKDNYEKNDGYVFEQEVEEKPKKLILK